MTRSKASDLVPGQRLQGFASSWAKFRANKFVVDLVRYGHKLKFAIPLKLSRPRDRFATRLPPEQMKVLREEVSKFITKGAVRKLTREEAVNCPGFYSQLFAVPKPGENQWRMIIDMRKLNSHIDKRSFRMQGIKDVTTCLQPNMYAAVIDIKDAYYQ